MEVTPSGLGQQVGFIIVVQLLNRDPPKEVHICGPCDRSRWLDCRSSIVVQGLNNDKVRSASIPVWDCRSGLLRLDEPRFGRAQLVMEGGIMDNKGVSVLGRWIASSGRPNSI